MKKEIVYTDKYALILDPKVDAVKGDWVLCRTEIDTLWQAGDNIIQNLEWKVIAHLPLSDAPILEGVPLLPPLSQGEDVDALGNEFYPLNDDLYPNSSLIRKAFIKGYNIAKEKYKYTEEDVRRAYMKGKHGGITESYFGIDEFIQSLQQPSRPNHFECETITMNEGYTDESDSPYQEIEIPKTTTNSQGQVELVGKYI